MKYIAHTALWGALALALIQVAPPIAPNVFARTTTPSTIKNKKRRKHKKNKEVVPKGERRKHARKQA